MFSLTIVFGSGAPAVWTMLYKSEESARRTFDTIQAAINNDDAASISDDFSQIACLQATSIQGCMIENLDETIKLASKQPGNR